MASGMEIMLGSLVRMLGISQADFERLRAMFAPDKVQAALTDLRTRFDAMEQRNIEMHAMLSTISSRAPSYSPDEIAPQFQVEMSRQLDRMLEEHYGGNGHDQSASGTGNLRIVGADYE